MFNIKKGEKILFVYLLAMGFVPARLTKKDIITAIRLGQLCHQAKQVKIFYLYLIKYFVY